LERILGSPLPRRGFSPSGPGSGKTGEVVLTFDEAEAIRLADLEGLYQQAAAQRMGVSRQTFGRIIEVARRKMADALINGRALRIDGGSVAIADASEKPSLIAIPTTADGRIEERFGCAERFAVYTAQAGKLLSVEEGVAAETGPGCRAAAAASLAAAGVSVLICGCIGKGAVRGFGAHGIRVLRGASGPARLAAQAYALGRLEDSGEACEAGCPGGGKSCPP
jgi:predicted DNA-binding protein (UPF0251 family)/predicted Fe-Mo cluster-binding NifX family protein